MPVHVRRVCMRSHMRVSVCIFVLCIEVRTQQQNAAARKHLQPLKAENATPLTSVSASGQR